MKIAPDDFVKYMHDTYPDPDGYPFREAMLKAFDYISGNYHEREKQRQEIRKKIEDKIKEEMKKKNEKFIHFEQVKEYHKTKKEINNL